MVAVRSETLKEWAGREVEVALARGLVTATERACGEKAADMHGSKLALTVAGFYREDDGAQEEEGKRRGRLFVEFDGKDDTGAVKTWSAGGLTFAVGPVLACLEVKRTVGLGDWISGAALV